MLCFVQYPFFWHIFSSFFLNVSLVCVFCLFRDHSNPVFFNSQVSKFRDGSGSKNVWPAEVLFFSVLTGSQQVDRARCGQNLWGKSLPSSDQTWKKSTEIRWETISWTHWRLWQTSFWKRISRSKNAICHTLVGWFIEVIISRPGIFGNSNDMPL